MKLWRQRLRTARPSPLILVGKPLHLRSKTASAATIIPVLPARGSVGRLLEATAGKIAVAGAMLAAAAVIVLASGGPGVFGPLGSVISGHGARSATEAAATTGAAGSSSAIVAAPAGSALGLPSGSGGTGRSAPGQGAPGGRRSPGGGRTPAGGLPAIPTTPGGGGGGNPSQPSPGNPPPPQRPPPQGGQAIDAAGDAVEQIGHQAPAVQPITDPVGRLTHQVADTCRRLPACP
jgi:hypothetical protein